jgi:MYXO-CTERM domain-containing protein
MSYRYTRGLASWALFSALLAPAVLVHAQLREPADTVNAKGFGPIPVDPRSLCKAGDTKVGGSIACTGSAYTGDYVQYSGNTNTLENLSLIGLFNYYESDRSKPMLDYALDAHAEPGTFSPLCNISAKLLLRGTGCLVDFGWYCADGTPNPLIHPLVTLDNILTFATLSNPPYPKSWQSSDHSFLPKVGYEVSGTPLTSIANDPTFKQCKTKRIGFAVLGNSTKNCGTSGSACACTQNKFTEQALNQVSSASNAQYINALTYASKVQPGRFYVAFEDLPTSELQFDAPYVVHSTAGDTTWNADGDFNDFVYAVEGVVCDGSGQLCDVPGAKGMCAVGMTGCSRSGSSPACEPVFQARTELCNGLDDDCDGAADNGDNLCSNGSVCYGGKCIHSCASTGEFACPTGRVCIAPGICVESACANTTCDAGQRCIGGQCVENCAGVQCPAGTECHAGQCIDLCNARKDGPYPSCPDNFVCQRGACVPNCTCSPCPNAGQTCDADATSPTYGQCFGSACTGASCSTGGAPGVGGANALGGGAGTGGAFGAASGGTFGAASGGTTPVIAAATGGAVTLGGSAAIGASTSSILIGGALAVGGNAATAGGAASALGGNTTAASTCEPGHETCPCYGNDTCNAGLTCASHLCVFLGTGGTGATGGVANTGGQSAATSGVGGETNPTATQGSEAKSGCGCRSAPHSQPNFGWLVAGVLALVASHRRTRVRVASSRQARRTDRSMES